MLTEAELYERRHYISGPMSGYPEYNYPKFRWVTSYLREQGFQVESPHENEWPTEELEGDALWEYMMKKCHEQMDRCNSIILLENFAYSRGAMIELKYMADKGACILFFCEPLDALIPMGVKI